MRNPFRSYIQLWFLLTGILGNVFCAPEGSFTPSQDIANAMAKFSLNFAKLFSHELDSDKNVIFSPFSLYTALALLELGSDGNTRKEISQVLSLPDDPASSDKIYRDFQKLINHLRSSHNQVELEVANGIFLQNGSSVKTEYVKKIRELTESEAKNVNFFNEREKTVRIINEWISNKTKNRISNLFKEQFDPNTVLVLASSLYYLGTWKHTFSVIRKEKFHTLRSEIEVRLMGIGAVIPYINDANQQYEAISIPYVDDNFSMTFILPYVNTTINTFLSQLTDTTLLHLMRKLDEQSAEVNYRIPKMTIEWKKNVAEDIKKLGIQELFTEKANLTHMVYGTADGVHVSTITHATQIQTNTHQTIATATTVADLADRITGGYYLKNAVNFTINRPFVFLIRHTFTNTILFMGLINKPL